MPREWKTGAPILYRGRELALEVFPARRARIAPDLFNLTVLHPHAQDEREVAAARRQVAARRGVGAGRAARRRLRRDASRAARRRCGCPTRAANGEAATRSGEIRLNWRLVQLPPALAEYVVAHEVAHLVELNHSPRFWALVETLMPGHAALRRELDDWTALLAA